MTPDDLKARVTTLLNDAKRGDGVHDHGVAGLRLFQYGQTTELTPQSYRPLACVVLQGGKDVFFQDQKIELRPGHLIVVSQHICANSRVSVGTYDDPYLAVVLPFDIARLQRFAAKADVVQSCQTEAPSLRSYPLDVETCLAFEHCLSLRPGSSEADLLYETYGDELYARFLLGQAGNDLRQLLSRSSKANRIARAIDHIRSNLAEGSRIDELISISGMSNSALHVAFRQATGKTPIQFQKELRLLEARSRLTMATASVSEVAFCVGYASTTQFSRDYKSKFGVSPRQDRTKALRELS